MSANIGRERRHRVLPDSASGGSTAMHLGSKDVVKLPYGRFGIWIKYPNSSPITEATGTQTERKKGCLLRPCWLLCRNADMLIIRGLRMNF